MTAKRDHSSRKPKSDKKPKLKKETLGDLDAKHKAADVKGGQTTIRPTLQDNCN